MIKSIFIKNFKSIKELKIDCSESFNLLVGENNIGKTTIFEAIHLWKICFDSCIKKDKKSFYSLPQNIPFINMESIRIYGDNELFNNIKKIKRTLEVSLVLEWNNEEFSLGFKLNGPSIRNSYLQLNYVDKEEFKKFEKIVLGIHGKNLASFLSINEAKTVTNIIAKEPYMYKGQIKDKISKGKSYEVLRNKIISNVSKVEEGISAVLDNDFKFKEIDKENKNYIELQVNGNNLLSYGSGFLQLAEIFSSIEFSDAKINILLFDEPEAHLHFKIQKKLIDYLRKIEHTQIFVITHNEKILDATPEKEILFIGTDQKDKGYVASLIRDSKILIKQNLTGVLSELDKIHSSEKVLIVEGETDKKFIKKLFDIKKVEYPIISIKGVDTLIEKVTGINDIIGDKKIFILRDTDWMPLSKIEDYKNSILKRLPVPTDNKKIVFQEGYGIESSIICDIEEFYSFIKEKYCTVTTIKGNDEMIKDEIKSLNIYFSVECKKITSDIYNKIKNSFENQKIRRENEDYYKKLTVDKILKEINESNIHYIMNKEILEMYLSKISNILDKYQVKAKDVKCANIVEEYLDYIESGKDIFKSHKKIIDEVYNY